MALARQLGGIARCCTWRKRNPIAGNGLGEMKARSCFIVIRPWANRNATWIPCPTDRAVTRSLCRIQKFEIYLLLRIVGRLASTAASRHLAAKRGRCLPRWSTTRRAAQRRRLQREARARQAAGGERRQVGHPRRARQNPWPARRAGRPPLKTPTKASARPRPPPQWPAGRSARLQAGAARSSTDPGTGLPLG